MAFIESGIISSCASISSIREMISSLNSEIMDFDFLCNWNKFCNTKKRLIPQLPASDVSAPRNAKTAKIKAYLFEVFIKFDIDTWCFGGKIMSEFEIDGKTFDTEKLDDKQKRIIGLYQKALKNEAEAIADLELARASRIEVGRKLKEEVIDKEEGLDKK